MSKMRIFIKVSVTLLRSSHHSSQPVTIEEVNPSQSTKLTKATHHRKLTVTS